ncbi:hypothetical protein A2U01_0046863 [Trifolium medium]|uniref:RNase H type-1 domain-containing protein n=1 Tax=Trifolium medium TaxID=97028 RepID=A0A392QP87_9FABA|nr:hypothetical protein [Trifolium medium]
MVNRLDVHKAVIEMDAKNVIDVIQKKNYPRVYWGKVAWSCEAWFQRNNGCSIRWVSRDGNKVAHELACWAGIELNLRGVGLLIYLCVTT